VFCKRERNLQENKEKGIKKRTCLVKRQVLIKKQRSFTYFFFFFVVFFFAVFFFVVFLVAVFFFVVFLVAIPTSFCLCLTSFFNLTKIIYYVNNFLAKK